MPAASGVQTTAGICGVTAVSAHDWLLFQSIQHTYDVPDSCSVSIDTVREPQDVTFARHRLQIMFFVVVGEV